MPNPENTVVIAGAGPAGSTLAIRLRKLGLSVVLTERYQFPREKLCGEFISPECLAHFDELGVLDEMLAAGGERIFETLFYEVGGRSVSVPTEWFGSGRYALSLSRARMDQILLKRARATGAIVKEGCSVTGLLIVKGIVSGVKVRGLGGEIDEIAAGITIDATGRGRVLSRFAEKQFSASPDEKPDLVGFKAHLSAVKMPRGVCEIYGFRGGYAGLSFVEGDAANLCFLVRSRLLAKLGNADAVFDELKHQNRRAAETLRGASKKHDWLAVSIPRFGLGRGPLLPGLYTVGDAAAFIDPFTGSGMLMAMESASLLARAIELHGGEREKLSQTYSAAHRGRFRSRLGVSRAVRYAAYEPFLSTAVVRVLSMSKTLRAALARRTRNPHSSFNS